MRADNRGTRVKGLGFEQLETGIGNTNQSEVSDNRVGKTGLAATKAEELFGIPEKSLNRPAAAIPLNLVLVGEGQVVGEQVLGGELGTVAFFENG